MMENSKPEYKVWMFKEDEQNSGKMIADHAEPSPAEQNKNKKYVWLKARELMKGWSVKLRSQKENLKIRFHV